MVEKNNYVNFRMSSLDSECLEKFRKHLENMIGEKVTTSQAIRSAIKRAWSDVEMDVIAKSA